MAISFEQYGGINVTTDDSKATYGRIVAAANTAGVHPFYYISNKNYYLTAQAKLDTSQNIYINSLSTELGFYNGNYSNQNRNGRFLFLVDTAEPEDNKNLTATDTSSLYECDFSDIVFGTTPSNHKRIASLKEGTGIFKGETLYVKISIELEDPEYVSNDRFGLTFTTNTTTLYTTFEYTLAQKLGRVFIQQSDGSFQPHIPYIYTANEGWQPYQAYIYENNKWSSTKYTP